MGLTVRHGLAHVTRSVLEGVAFGLRQGLDLMVAAGVEVPSAIRGSGGGLKSPLWRQILADVLRSDIETLETDEGAAYGAAVLASVGAGIHASVEDATAAVVSVRRAAGVTDPEAYTEAYGRYVDLYPALKPGFDAVAGDD